MFAKNLPSALSASLIAASLCLLPASSIADNADDIRARVKKIGSVMMTEKTTAPTKAVSNATSKTDQSAASDAKTLYQASCFACHGTGAAGAPKLGDAPAWVARIAQGQAVLNKNAIEGILGMPARGGSNLDDAAIKAIVAYMVEQSQ